MQCVKHAAMSATESDDTVLSRSVGKQAYIKAGKHTPLIMYT